MIDFTNCPLSGKSYSGMDCNKMGIIYNGSDWFLKRPVIKVASDSPGFAIEHVASQIFRNLGVCTHETLLGTYQGKNVVAVKDFTTNETELVEFASANGRHVFNPPINEVDSSESGQIAHSITANRALNIEKEIIQHFWRMFVVDALIANSDRHSMNWGFLKDIKTNMYVPSPVYDNGMSLYCRESERDIAGNFDDIEELRHLVYEKPSSKIKVKGKEHPSYFDVIASRAYKDCNEAADWLRSTFEISKITKPIIACEAMTERRKEFLIKIIPLRFQAIFNGFKF